MEGWNRLIANVETLKLNVSQITIPYAKEINITARATPGEQVILVVSPRTILIL